VLGSPRGYRIVRTITHFHSPYSWDACDKNGLPDGKPDANCMADITKAVCSNHIDFLFLTDHPDHMSDYEFDQLKLPGIEKCDNGAHPEFQVGFESTLMALGMSGHLDPDPTTRKNLYNDNTPATATRLKTDVGALVVIPHTESKTLDWIKTIQPDAIEIYNFHANVDPKIRQNDLGLPPFKDIPGILTYLFDPYHSLQADFAFLSFFEIHPTYMNDWDALLASGMKVTGLAGTDSHENIFPQKVSDGERFDSHRRVTRIFSNYLLVQNVTVADAKDAIAKGRSWLVMEGLGTPTGMDYTATPLDGAGVEGTPVGTGESLTIAPKAVIRVNLPILYSGSPTNGQSPLVRIELKHVKTDGTEEVVAKADSAGLTYTTDVTGPYRAEVYITPLHLSDLLSDFSSNASIEYPWILTNPIYLEP
jgi:hypothetical protein